MKQGILCILHAFTTKGRNMNKIILLAMSAFSAFLLLSPPSKLGIIAALGWTVISVLLILYFQGRLKTETLNLKPSKLTYCVTGFILICYFANQWSQKQKVMELCAMLHASVNLVLCFAGMMLLLFAYPFFQSLFQLLKYIAGPVQKGKTTKKYREKRCSAKEIFFLLLASVFTMTLFSRCSFLYPFNTWEDSNCFFTVGKSILHGLVPYKDIYEQKGPILYFLHSIAALFSSTSFIGVYFLEIMACYFVLYYCYKIAVLYMNKSVIWCMPAFSFLIYGAVNFCEGDSAEELCLPFLAYALYLAVRWFKERKAPSSLEFIMIGITSGFVLWIKFTILGFYIGWIIVPFLFWIKNKEIKKMFVSLGLIALGVLLTTLPVILYFGLNNALKDLFTVYFYNNMFLYNGMSDNSSILANIFGHMEAFTSYKLIVFFILLSFVSLDVTNSNFQVSWAVSCIFLFTVSFIFIGQSAWPYYSFVLNLFTIFGFIFLVRILCLAFLANKKKKYILYLAVNVLCLIAGMSASHNISFMSVTKEDLPQYKFKETVEKYDGDKDITLLNYGFLDGGFYTVMEVLPSTKFFCQLNIILPEMYEEMDECINLGRADYVVTKNMELDSENYALVDQAGYTGSSSKYYLYRKVTS
jgi:hypothetical protein